MVLSSNSRKEDKNDLNFSGNNRGMTPSMIKIRAKTSKSNETVSISRYPLGQ